MIILFYPCAVTQDSEGRLVGATLWDRKSSCDKSIWLWKVPRDGKGKLVNVGSLLDSLNVRKSQGCYAWPTQSHFEKSLLEKVYFIMPSLRN